MNEHEGESVAVKECYTMLITQYTALLLQSSGKKSESTTGNANTREDRPIGGDGFLEPYLQGLGPDVAAPLHQRQPSGGSAGDRSPPDTPSPPPPVSATVGFPHVRTSSRESLDQEHELSLSERSSGCEGSDGEGDVDEVDGGSTACYIGLVERLIRTHPVWFLPGIQRAGAVHLLQGKEEGNFVVRQSSQPDTMALSVRLPTGKGPYIEHYLIQAQSGHLSLESSENRFDDIKSLVAHYAKCCDELPVQLTLPRALREAKNRQQLSSLALLGQEFWRYPMANPRPPDRCEGSSPQSPPSSGSSLSSFSSGNNNMSSRTPTLDLVSGGGDSIVLNLVPLQQPPEQPLSLLSTFKGSPSPSSELGSPSSPTGQGLFSNPQGPSPQPTTARATRPTPPSTLNLASSTLSRSSSSSPGQLISPPAELRALVPAGRTPPPPPPRWAKPGHNFTVTTTVTFSVNNAATTTPPPHVEVSCVQVAPKRSTDSAGEGFHSLSSQCSSIRSPSESATSPAASTPSGEPSSSSQAISSTTPSATTPAPKVVKRTRARKESHHYQESDILESPTVYYRSSVADKQSDYEDIWGPQEGQQQQQQQQQQQSLTSFKPRSPTSNRRTPDLLERVTSSEAQQLSGSRNKLGLSINTQETRSEDTSGMCTPTCALPATGVVTTPSSGVSGGGGGKQGSPFYAEPADALRQGLQVTRRKPRLTTSNKHRHSDPVHAFVPPCKHGSGGGGGGGGALERIDSLDEISTPSAATPVGLSTSVDNLLLRNGMAANKARNVTGGLRLKPVQTPRVHGKSFNDTSWAVDSSWEFIGREEEAANELRGGRTEVTSCESSPPTEERERRFPTLEQQEVQLEVQSPGSGTLTVLELIAQRFPSLRLSPECPTVGSGAINGHPGVCDDVGVSRMSSYDNVEGRNGHRATGSQISDNEDTQTIFSEPWDSAHWENLLRLDPPATTQSETTPHDSDSSNNIINNNEDLASNVSRNKSFKERLDPLLSPPRLQALRNRELGGTGASIRAYALHLAGDKSTTFAQNIDNFIACTRDSRETSPQIVMRNMRQFMSGMKNYLVKHGEREFEKEVEKERVKLKSTEFLNLDAILEGVMHKLVVRPLKEHLYRLFVDEYTRSGAIQLLADNIRYARTKHLSELGVRAKILPPDDHQLKSICHYLKQLQEVDSPLEKLENLLTCISHIFNSVKSRNQGRGYVTLGADDFLPIFVWVLVQSGMMAAEIEAEYMWGLLHPSLLSGEGGYYLTTLSSAVHVLKNFRICSEEQSASLDWRSGSLSEFRSVLKIVVPDELHGSILTKTLPVRPGMTTRDVCKIIAHKARITNPQDYGLFQLVDGEETLLADGDCPQDVKGTQLQAGKHCIFAYKRIDAKIAWPRTSSPDE